MYWCSTRKKLNIHLDSYDHMKFPTCAWLRVNSSGFCFKDMETLPIWWDMSDFHRPLESKVFDESEGIEHATRTVSGIVERLWFNDKKSLKLHNNCG